MTITATATKTTYSIDKAHSEATFQVRHLLSKVRGRFSDFEGTIRLRRAEPGIHVGERDHPGGQH